MPPMLVSSSLRDSAKGMPSSRPRNPPAVPRAIGPGLDRLVGVSALPMIWPGLRSTLPSCASWLASASTWIWMDRCWIVEEFCDCFDFVCSSEIWLVAVFARRSSSAEASVRRVMRYASLTASAPAAACLGVSPVKPMFKMRESSGIVTEVASWISSAVNEYRGASSLAVASATLRDVTTCCSVGMLTAWFESDPDRIGLEFIGLTETVDCEV